MKHNAVRRILLLSPAVLMTVATLAFAAAPLEEPDLPTPTIPRVTFGDTAMVQVLAEVMKEDDPLVREQAVWTLGKTHNPAAAPLVREAMEAPEPSVQSAAAVAAAELGADLCGDVLRAAIAPGRDVRVVLQGLRGIQRTSLLAASSDVEATLARDETLLQTAGLRTLTSLGKGASVERLTALLTSPSAAVRVQACENAALTSPVGDLSKVLTSLARDDEAPAVRGAALAALARVDFSAAESLALRATQAPHPLVRRGAVRAWEAGKMTSRAREMLNDASPPVVLEATRAVGRMVDRESVARLYEILIQTPDNDLHDAARESLLRIQGDSVHEGAVAAFVAEANRLPAPQGQRLRVPEPILERNLRSLCVLLAHFHSDRELDRRLAMMTTLRIDSPVQFDLIPSVAAAGDPRAVAPLLKLVDLCRAQGGRWLHAQTLPIPPPVEYNDFVSEYAIDALGALDVARGAEAILQTAMTKYKSGRLSRAAVAAARLAVALAKEGDRAKVEAFLLDVLSDGRYTRDATFQASKAVGKLKVAQAEAALREILTVHRWDRWSMRAAAWGLQEITGQTPEIGDPVTREDADWLIHKTGR